MATVYKPLTKFAVGGPAVVKILEDKFCKVAIINTAPFNLHLESDDFNGTVEVINFGVTQVQPMDEIPIAWMFAIQEVKT